MSANTQAQPTKWIPNFGDVVRIRKFVSISEVDTDRKLKENLKHLEASGVVIAVESDEFGWGFATVEFRNCPEPLMFEIDQLERDPEHRIYVLERRITALEAMVARLIAER